MKAYWFCFGQADFVQHRFCGRRTKKQTLVKAYFQGATGADFLRAVRRQIAFHRPSNVYTEDENYIYV